MAMFQQEPFVVPNGTLCGVLDDVLEDPPCDVQDPFPDDVTLCDGEPDVISMTASPGRFVPDEVVDHEPCEERDWNSPDPKFCIDFIEIDKNDPSIVEEQETLPELGDLDDKEIIDGDLWWA